MSKTKKKFFALALVLWIAGVTGFGWILLEQKKEKQLQYQKQEALKTKFAKLDKLFNGEVNIQSLTADAGKENWEEESAGYQKIKNAMRPHVLTASTTCMAMGTVIFAGGLLFSMARCIAAGLSHSKKFLTNILRSRKHARNNQLIENFLKKDNSDPSMQKHGKPDGPKESLAARDKRHSDDSYKKNYKNDVLNVLYCDEKSLSCKEQAKFGNSYAGLNVPAFDQLEQNIRKTILSDYHQDILKVQNSLNAQNESLEKQANEFRLMAQTVKEASAGHSEPVETTLTELTQQVSEIREFASYQQERNEKLQEGYDWNIIRTFCLRVIHCIDNLENRITRLSEQDIDTTDLEEIMDELLFALESSGVEQFKPKINSDYNGQEKTSEVVKDKACTNNPEMTGKIAGVVKPGYRYVIDDGNVKVVRAARVKLFG